MNKTIIQYIQQQKVATVSILQPNGAPYCFSCFYAYNEKDTLLIYKTSSDSYHSSIMFENQLVAGTILPDKLNTLALQGIQFEGEVIGKENQLFTGAIAKYYAKFPFAVAMPGDIWVIQVNHFKMTDNTKVFGKKLQWNRKENFVEE